MLLILVGVFVLGIAGCTALIASKTGSVSTGPAGAATSTAPQPAPATKGATTKSLTTAQQQAIGAAQDYLSSQAFSRKGLIGQLSSDAGDGYSVADATFAVDSLHVDWNAQAEKSAKDYLSSEHFSRKDLTEQLESSSGEGFTHAQAVYGVDHAY